MLSPLSWNLSWAPMDWSSNVPAICFWWVLHGERGSEQWMQWCWGHRLIHPRPRLVWQMSQPKQAQILQKLRKSPWWKNCRQGRKRWKWNSGVSTWKKILVASLKQITQLMDKKTLALTVMKAISPTKRLWGFIPWGWHWGDVRRIWGWWGSGQRGWGETCLRYGAETPEGDQQRTEGGSWATTPVRFVRRLSKTLRPRRTCRSLLPMRQQNSSSPSFVKRGDGQCLRFHMDMCH